MNNFTPAVLVQLKNEMQNLADTMNIPFHQRGDAQWLLHNASVENAEHKNLQKLIRIATIIASEELKGNKNDKR